MTNDEKRGKRLPRVYHRCGAIQLNKNGTRRLHPMVITSRTKKHRTYMCKLCGLKLRQDLLPEEEPCTVL